MFSLPTTSITACSNAEPVFNILPASKLLIYVNLPPLFLVAESTTFQAGTLPDLPEYKTTLESFAIAKSI